MVTTCWGPALGAKVLKYRSAVILGILCQTFGAVGFGTSTALPFGGLLEDWTLLRAHPKTTMYTLMWVSVVPAIGQAMALWRGVLVPTHLALGRAHCTAAFGCCCSHLYAAMTSIMRMHREL